MPCGFKPYLLKQLVSDIFSCYTFREYFVFVECIKKKKKRLQNQPPAQSKCATLHSFCVEETAHCNASQAAAKNFAVDAFLALLVAASHLQEFAWLRAML